MAQGYHRQNFGRGTSLHKKVTIRILVFGAALTASLAVFGGQNSASSPQSTPSAEQNSQPKPAEDQTQDQKQDQSVPDAPSAVQPPAPIPNLPPTPGTEEQTRQTPAPQAAPQAPPANQAPPRTMAPGDQESPGPRPPLNVRTVPEGGATSLGSDTQDQLFRIVTNVNQVLIPVTVKD